MPPILGNFVLKTSVQGEFGFDSAQLMFTILASADTWVGEFTFCLNGEEVDLIDGPLRLIEGIDNILELRVRKDSILIDSTSVTLEMLEAGELGLEFFPSLGTPWPVTTAPLSWSVSAREGHFGAFMLQLTSPELPSRPLPGEVIYFAEDVYFDTFPIAFGVSVGYPCHGASHTVSIRPTPSNRLLGKYVQLVWGGAPAESLGVVVTPALANPQLLTLEGVTWELDCLNTNQDGDFSLQLVVESEETSALLAMSLGHNLVRADHWATEHSYWPDWIPFYIRHIRAISVHLNAVAPGVKVSVNDNPPYQYTDAKGEYSQREAKLVIINQYDKTIV